MTWSGSGYPGNRPVAPSAAQTGHAYLTARKASLPLGLSGGPEQDPGWRGSWLARPAPEAFVLREPDAAALIAAAQRIADIAPGLSDTELGDLACQLGRAASEPGGFRLGIVASGQQDLARRAAAAARLARSLDPGRFTAAAGVFAGNDARGRVVLLFPGLGIGQDAGTGTEACTPPPPFRLTDPEAVQPAILHASLSGLRWLDRLGVTATAAIGHSLGEITGLVWAGCLSETEATRLVAQRSAVISASGARQTAMVSVATGADAARELAAGTDLVIAAYNGPRSQVLAGPAAAVRELTRRAERQGIRAVVLDVSHAFHSPAMAGCVAPLRAVLADIQFRAPRRPLFSTVTGREITPADDIAAMLCTALTSPVRFAEALAAACIAVDLLCEAGPGHALATLAEYGCDIPSVSLETPAGEDTGAARTAAALFAAGVIDSLAPMLTGRSAQPINIWPKPGRASAPPGRASATAANITIPGITIPGIAIPDSTASGGTAFVVPGQANGPGAAITGYGIDAGVSGLVNENSPEGEGSLELGDRELVMAFMSAPAVADVLPAARGTRRAGEPISPASQSATPAGQPPCATARPGPAAAQGLPAGSQSFPADAQPFPVGTESLPVARPAATARLEAAVPLGRPAADAERARPGLSGRFLQRIRENRPGSELIADSQLDLDSDPYLAGYRIDGAAMLPAVLILEAMAQAASALAGRPLLHAEQVCFDAPVLIQPDKILRVSAKREGRYVTATLRSQQDGRWIDHGRAIFRQADPLDLPRPGEGSSSPGRSRLWETAGPTLDVLDSTDLYDLACFQSGRFRRVAFLPDLSSRHCRGLVRGDDGEPWFGASTGLASAPPLLGSPGLNDATIHVLQACFPHHRMLPAGCESVTFSGRPTGGAVEVSAAQRLTAPAVPAGLTGPGGSAGLNRPRLSPRTAPEDGLAVLAGLSAAPAWPAPDEYAWDVTAVDAAGQVIITWRGLRLVDAGPMAGSPALPPGLLGVLLERGASGLGLDPALKIAVRREEPQRVPAAHACARSAASAPPRLAGWVSARSRGRLEEFSLRLRAASPAACAWATADLEQPASGDVLEDSDPEFAALRRRLRDVLTEPAPVVDARISTAVECLSKAGRPVGCELIVDGCYAGGWTLLRAGDVSIACTVVQVSGISSPVAVSIMTGSGTKAAAPAE